MADWSASRAKITDKLSKIAERGTITFTSKALNRTGQTETVDVWVLIKSRNVPGEGKPATITALVTWSERNVENGVLTVQDKRYQIVKLDQTGAGANHLLSEVVASEL
jgi:hypothetical protein